ncbi:MAG: hypothetical protein Tsb009_11680 [Planctomycetaceae bacterium]
MKFICLKKIALNVFVTLPCLTLMMAAKPVPHQLETLKSPPKGLSKAVADSLNPNGFAIKGPKGSVCEIWLAKSIPVTPGFKPTLNVKYPFKAGELIGALRVPENQKFTDFRGQELKPGVYTLRYGKQPEDGNHIGTSELADFLLAIPGKIDKSPKAISLVDTLHSRSAKSSGGTHPAIFSLLPGKKIEKSTLAHDSDKEFWILTTNASGKAKGKMVSVPLRMVVIGKSAE